MKTTLAIIAALLFNGALTAANSCVSGAPNLVANCGFESGNFTGWFLTGADSAPAYNGVDWGVDAADAHSGQYGAYLAGLGSVLTLNQTLATTPGTTYDISFWLATPTPPGSPYVDSSDVAFGNTTLLSGMDLAATPYTEYSYTAAATSTATALSFGFRDDTGFFSLDDISVTRAAATAVPEPTAFPLCALTLLLLAAAIYRKRRLFQTSW